ncbi:energy transducer TonB [Psychroflexus sediminis]|uniref:Protein TonB n=1 Tax=Psychroflexus sediminis TaxID=470826 RepID=A0A1G7ZEX7_9FLAO|nr:hypothetical protein [Psychroflexus sediminis]SDH07291.1 protein TonB [Psychroflexus sediminis]
MKPKKYLGKNLNRKKTLFFQMGLIVTLVCILILVEWKTEARTTPDQETMIYLLLDDEEMPVVKIPEEKLNPIPESKPDTEDFSSDEDEPEVQEKLPEPEDQVSTPVFLDLDEIDKIKDEPIKEMPFEFIEDVPIFPGCEQYQDNERRKSCMSEQLERFINKEFDTGLASDLGLSGVNRIYTSFKIKANGEAEFINARAPHPKLIEESRRVIEKLPRMKPGRQRGNPIDVIFALPITFKVSN